MLLILPKVVVVVSNYYVSFNVGDLVAIDPESRDEVFEGPHSLSISTSSHLMCTLLSCTSLCIWLCVFILSGASAISLTSPFVWGVFVFAVRLERGCGRIVSLPACPALSHVVGIYSFTSK